MKQTQVTADSVPRMDRKIHRIAHRNSTDERMDSGTDLKTGDGFQRLKEFFQGHSNIPIFLKYGSQRAVDDIAHQLGAGGFSCTRDLDPEQDGEFFLGIDAEVRSRPAVPAEFPRVCRYRL